MKASSVIGVAAALLIAAVCRKRGGDTPHISLELEGAEGRYQLEPQDDTTPETVFDRRWALTLLANVLGKLRTECVEAGKEVLFDQLKVFLGGRSPATSYASVGRDLHMSEGAVKVAVHRLRRRYRDLLRQEIAQTVSAPDEVEAEIGHLRSALSR